jgi:16S rRNA (cytosine967-C5)-methyltransferase
MSDAAPHARAVALEVLDRVLGHGRPLDQALAEHAAPLAPRDLGFARTLLLTALRRLGEIDAALARFVTTPLPAKARPARQILRLGAAQILFLGTPAHAAVDTSVRLAQTRPPARPYKRLINAVLRRVAEQRDAILEAADAERLDTPDWLWERWCATYGEETCRAIARAHLAEAPLDLSVKADPDTWAERLGARPLPTGSLRLDHAGPVAALAGYADGAWWVQDAAAALPARLLGDVAGRDVIDLCAAPGGKTAQLAAAGARVVAVDRSEARLGRLRENLARLGLQARVVAADAETWRPDVPADGVLLDAPCSATGTIRRHPDVAWLKKPADVAALAAVQARLLGAAAAMVRPGGLVVYCACSLEPEEGPERMQRLFAEDAGLARVPVAAAEIGGLADAVTEDGALRTLPCHLAEAGRLDGFFAFRVRKL